MGEEKGKLESIREWVVEHKLRAVGTLWASGIVGSMAYNWSQPNMKTSVKIIHARFGMVDRKMRISNTWQYFYPSVQSGFRLHAQALTLAALAGAAVVEYYDHKTGAKAERVAKFLEFHQQQPHKD